MGFTVSVNYHDTISYGSRQPKKQVKQWWGPPVYEVPKTKPEDLTELQSNFATEYRIFKQLDADENGVLSKEELWDKLARWEEGVANKVYAMVDANDVSPASQLLADHLMACPPETRFAYVVRQSDPHPRKTNKPKTGRRSRLLRISHRLQEIRHRRPYGPRRIPSLSRAVLCRRPTIKSSLCYVQWCARFDLERIGISAVECLQELPKCPAWSNDQGLRRCSGQ